MVRRKMTLSQDSALRKNVPLYRGLFRYFPAALAGVAHVSMLGGAKHCGGELYHNREASGDHLDCQLRHILEVEENDGIEPSSGLPQVFFDAWRALAAAQKFCEEKMGAPIAPAARNAEKEPNLFDGSVPAGCVGAKSPAPRCPTAEQLLDTVAPVAPGRRARRRVDDTEDRRRDGRRDATGELAEAVEEKLGVAELRTDVEPLPTATMFGFVEAEESKS
jgi:hypothetical protein